MKVEREIVNSGAEFKHRLVVTDNGERVEGFWYGYKGLASVMYKGRMFKACTDYYEGELPINAVFEVKVMP